MYKRFIYTIKTFQIKIHRIFSRVIEDLVGPNLVEIFFANKVIDKLAVEKDHSLGSAIDSSILYRLISRYSVNYSIIFNRFIGNKNLYFIYQLRERAIIVRIR